MKLNFKNLVELLSYGYDGNKTLLEGMKCCWDYETGYFNFMKHPEQVPLKKSVMITEDWDRFYKFDAIEDYEDPNVFVAECIAEEFLNRFELEAAYEEAINDLMEKHRA